MYHVFQLLFRGSVFHKKKLMTDTNIPRHTNISEWVHVDLPRVGRKNGKRGRAWVRPSPIGNITSRIRIILDIFDRQLPRTRIS